MASRPVPTATDGSGRVIGGPHPAFGHPLPEGGGLGFGRSHRPSATLSQRERGWIWDGSHRPSATLSPEGEGLDLGRVAPAFGHPLPGERGFTRTVSRE